MVACVSYCLIVLDMLSGVLRNHTQSNFRLLAHCIPNYPPQLARENALHVLWNHNAKETHVRQNMQKNVYVAYGMFFPHFFSRSEAFRAALILLDEDALSRKGFNGPYAHSSRQKGFVTFGVSHIMKILGSVETAQRAAWYQKWNVHLFARPEVRLSVDRY